jgi:L-alanine-DL-glutamate epimerase-like enolase superfamily enzyme
MYEWPRKKPMTNGRHTFSISHLNMAVVKTDEGITGIGASPSVDYVEYFKQFLIGENPLDNERLWELMWVPKIVGRRSISTRSIAAIDIALWDIKSKAANMPLYKLLGGHKNKIPCYFAGGYYAEGKGMPELQKEMEEFVTWGAKGVKMKVGVLSAKEDAARVKAVREAIGDDIKLMVDANCAYSFYDAIDLARRIEEYDLSWLEEPVMPDDYDGLKKVAQHTNIPIATGENEYTRYGFRDLIGTGAVAVINPDAAIVGGITEFMKVAAYAQANYVDMAPHGTQQVHIHLTAASPNSKIMECYPPHFFEEKTYTMYENPVIFDKDGNISPPERPGVGLEVNQEVMAPFRVK